ncbi:hypothetical protein QFZ20_000887 [Flavobacterium sp. W4I14]|nr:hypothetical protein [Flavobacterium sp. W4I14]
MNPFRLIIKSAAIILIAGELFLAGCTAPTKQKGKSKTVSAQLGGKQIPLAFKQENNLIEIRINETVNIQKNQVLTISIA